MWIIFYTGSAGMCRWIIIALLVAINSTGCFAQASPVKSVVIGTMQNRPNALLSLNPPGNDQGLLIPQLTTLQRLSMRPNSPGEDGLLIFDMTEKLFYYWKTGAWVSMNSEPSSFTWTGDLTGAYTHPNVSRLQGNAVAAVALGGTDAGKVLTWDGTQWLPALPVNAAPRYAMIDPAAFTNLRRSDKKDKDNIIMFDDNSTFVTTIKKREGPFIIAPLNLPDGATIQQVTVYYMDRDAEDILLNIYRKTPTGGNEAVISWTSSGSSASIQNVPLAPAGGREVIDNSNYSYRIVVRLDQSGDVTTSDDATLRLYAVRVKYLP